MSHISHRQPYRGRYTDMSYVVVHMTATQVLYLNDKLYCIYSNTYVGIYIQFEYV